MVQVKGICRPLTQRFRRDFAGSVKYSTLGPSRRDSPSEASRAMPTSGGFPGLPGFSRIGNNAADRMMYSPFVRYNRTNREAASSGAVWVWWWRLDLWLLFQRRHPELGAVQPGEGSFPPPEKRLRSG